MQILANSDLIETPWKNGGGVTRKIAAGLRGDQPGWTISRADVAQDGPFSDFAGLIRVLTVVSGAGMVLETPTGPLQAGLWQPVRFDGGLKAHARLSDGPLTDLNLMFDPAFCDGQAAVCSGPSDQSVTPPDYGLLVFHVLAGQPVIGAAPLTAGDTAFLDHAAPLRLGTGDAVLELRLSYRQTEAIRLCIAKR
jgi:uncharacterized protein